MTILDVPARSRFIFLLVAIAVACMPRLAGFPAPSRQSASGFWSFLSPGRTVARCTPSSAVHAQAKAQLAALAERIDRLANADPVDPALRELYALLKHECFLPAVEAGRIAVADTSLSLKQWWNDGGDSWLASYLDLPKLGTIPDVVPHVVVPPDVRVTLALDTHRTHRLSRLLCSLSDASCGAETRGWLRRAENSLDSPPDRFSIDGPRAVKKASDVARECAVRTHNVAARDRYWMWRRCLDDDRPRQSALPLGQFKAPRDGWFLVSGRRGHYEFCDGIRGYDLATGAAFVYESCSNLHLRPDGSVDRQSTSRGRTDRIAGGAVAADNLREAVLTILLREHAETVQKRAEYYPLPAGLTPEFTIARRSEHESSSSIGGGISTAHTTLAWRWMTADGASLEGTLTWPDSSDPAEAHAASLLGVAEEGIVEGCVPAEWPRVPSPAPPGHTGRPSDADPAWFDELDALYRSARDRWTRIERCR